MNDKISIIIPIYNTAEFLSDCIHSVRNQTYENLEIILVDDHSEDNSKELITELASQDHRIRTIHLPRRNGVGAARNVGLKEATGKYIYFLDSDDYLAKNTIELLANNIGDSVLLAGRIKKINVPVPFERIVTKNNALLKMDKKYKLFKKVSALHMLILKDFISSKNILFSEDTMCYSDLSFLLPFIKELEEIPRLKGSMYYKRTRNDPVTNPSLMQLPRETKVHDFINVYNQQRGKYAENEKVSNYLDTLFLNFFRKQIIMLLEDDRQVEKVFELLSFTAKKVNPSLLKDKNIVLKREIQLLAKGNQKGFANTVKLHHILRKTKNALRGRTKLYVQLYCSVFTKLPLKEKSIVFESFLGKNYSDSPKYIYEYMFNHNMDFKYIWIFNDKTKKIPGNAKIIKRFSLPYYYYLATSKYWVSNSRMPRVLKKREGNVYLQTWHGTPLKKLVFDMNDVYSANPKYKQHFYQQSRRWDYLISPNEFSSEVFKSAFKFDKKMLEVGYPRNDILYHEDKDVISETIKKRLGIPLDKKVILYAPTWRDDDFYEPGKYKFNLKLNLKEMKQKLGDEYVVILRMHYFIADNIETEGAEGFAYNLSKYDDIAELYLISDILITDYSSVFFDYANLQRPILFYTYDLEKYRDTLRGFYIDVENEVPGPLLKTSEEVIDCIQNIDNVKEMYKDKYNSFYNRFCSWDNGTAAEQVVKEVFIKNE